MPTTTSMLTVVPAADSPSTPHSPSTPSAEELLAENERLRETLDALKSGLQNGHKLLAESLQNLLSASSSDAETQRAARLSERQVGLYTAFLTSAVAIAADAAQISETSASSRARKGLRRKSSFHSWLTKLVSRYRRSPQRIAPPR